jgi:hypothetical protein
MNRFVEERYIERIHQLTVGLELFEAGSETRIPHAIEVRWDGDPSNAFYPLVSRHNSCLHVLLYDPNLKHPDHVDLSYYTPEVKFPPLRPLARQLKGRVKTAFFVPIGEEKRIDLRFIDPQKRYMPRRLRFPILDRVEAERELPPDQRFSRKIRRPVLFPGPAYQVNGSATGLRGRVTRGGRPVRWPRIEATLPNTNVRVGRAHGDEEGEFLLLIEPNASPRGGNLLNPLPIRVTAFVHAVPPVPSSPDLPLLDPFWDLPLEEASAPGALDPVTSGDVIPTGYVASLVGGTDVVDFRLGRILTGIEVKDFAIV